MNTILQEALSKEARNADDFKPLVGVGDNHLLTKALPSHSGTFSFSTSTKARLPSVPAKSFRLVNSGTSNVLVSKKTIYFSRHFNESVDMNRFIDNGVEIAIVKVDGNIASVDTIEDLKRVEDIINKNET